MPPYGLRKPYFNFLSLSRALCFPLTICSSSVLSPPKQEQLQQGAEEDEGIEPKRLAFDVVEVVLQAGLGVFNAGDVVVIHHGPASHSWLDAVP